MDSRPEMRDSIIRSYLRLWLNPTAYEPKQKVASVNDKNAKRFRWLPAGNVPVCMCDMHIFLKILEIKSLNVALWLAWIALPEG